MKKILVIRFDALGDTILTLPLLEALRFVYPKAEITVIASNRGQGVLKNCSLVDFLEVADHNDKPKIKILTEKIKKSGFDLSINVSEKIEGYKLAYKAKIPTRVGFRPGTVQPFKNVLSGFYCTHTAFYDNNPGLKQGLHEVERQFLLLKEIGINITPKRYSFDITEEIEKFADEKFAGNLIKGKFLSLHLSQKWLADGWDDFFLSKLAEAVLEANKDYNLLLTYGKTEKDLANKLREKHKHSRILFFSDPDFYKWAAVLKRTGLLITMDTSASHVAAGLNLPCITVFGEKYFDQIAERWSPWKTPYIAVKRAVKKAEKPNDENNFIKAVLNGVKELLK